MSVCDHQQAMLARLSRIVMRSPVLRPVLDHWHDVALPDCWLVAGGLAQSVWNDSFGMDPLHGIADIDLVYFDPEDLTEQGEAQNAFRIGEVFRDFPVRLDVKNEARVHLWYAAKFGASISPYCSTLDAITTFPTTATAVGIRPAGADIALVAPFGLDDLMGCVVRPNKKQITRDIYEAKVRRWTRYWPDLTIIAWDDVPEVADIG